MELDVLSCTLCHFLQVILTENSKLTHIGLINLIYSANCGILATVLLPVIRKYDTIGRYDYL